MGLPRTVAAVVSDDEHAAVRAVADRLGISVNRLVRQAMRRALRGPWTEEMDLLAEYDEIEIEIPKNSRLARFVLLAIPGMENCERYTSETRDTCPHCQSFLATFAPDLVLESDKFRVCEDGLTIERIREGVA